MRGLNITFVAAIAGLAVAASACEDIPTEPDTQMDALAVATSNGQDRVTLCHRSKDGEYVIVTVADAAYDKHMTHGDRDAGLNDACPGTGNSLLVVELMMPRSGNSGPVTVTLQPFDGEPATSFVECFPAQVCAYYVPTGSTVKLSSVSLDEYRIMWDFGATPECNYTCVMDVDRMVVATMR